ncbi:LysR family transcriptional regulator [Deinococcus cellulosilyticus]|nr:LysR family transcriptional regulator [Deinococcus cellulosilyticus]
MDQLNQLRSFLAIYRAGSLTRAAEFLHLTQPALTRQIKQLEARLNRQLFVRVARGVLPTPAAHELARKIASHLDALETLSDTLKVGHRSLAGTVFLGGPPEFLGERILPALVDLHEESIQIRVQLGTPDVLVQEVQSGTLDLLVSTARISTPDLQSSPLYQEELVLVGAAKWAEQIPDEASQAIEILSGMPLLGYAEDLPLIRKYWRQVFGVLPVAAASVVIPDLRALALSAASGGGVTVLPRYLAQEHLSAGTLLELFTPSRSPANQLYLVSKRDAHLHPRVLHVRQKLEERSIHW